MFAAFGASVLPGPIDYGTYCGLYYNLDVLRALRATEVAQGLVLALGRRIDPSFYAALAISPRQAKDMQFEAECQRREAAIAAKHGIQL